MKFIRFVSAVTACAMIALSFTAGADTVSDLQSKYNALEQEQKEIEENLKSTQSDISDKEEYQNSLQDKISVIQKQIDLLNQKIESTNKAISEGEKKIAETEKEIKETIELYKQRMRAAYMSPDPSMLGVLLGAESLPEFIMRLELVDRVSEYDAELVDKLSKTKEKLAEEKSKLEQDKKSLDSDKQEVLNKRSELEVVYSKAEKEINDLEQTAQDYEAQKAQIIRQQKQAESDIAAAIAAAAEKKAEQKKKQQEQNKDNDDASPENHNDDTGDDSGDSGSSSGGKFTWPCPGYNSYSPYGNRVWDDGWVEFHKGMDISGAGIYGARIVAADDGEVILAQNYDSGNGYGHYIIIDHGGGLITLYAHSSNVIVSTGQKVKRGQTIGYVGSTGWSTGPHLHFEVRLNGAVQNPEDYL